MPNTIASLEKTVARPDPYSPLAVHMGGPYTQDPIYKDN